MITVPDVKVTVAQQQRIYAIASYYGTMRPSQRNERADLYGNSSPFVRLLATRGRVRILDTFLRKYKTDLSAGDIEELIGVSESTFSRNKDVLLELDIIRPTRNVGGKQYYQLNIESPIVKILGQFHTGLLEHTEEISERTKISEEQYIGRVVTTEVRSQTSRVGDQKERDVIVDPGSDTSKIKKQKVLKHLGYL